VLFRSVVTSRSEVLPVSSLATVDLTSGPIEILHRERERTVILEVSIAENMPLETWQRVLAVNLDGTFSCSKAAGQSMLAAGSGAIINIASIMGMVGNTMYPNLAYNTAKGALINMTRALAVEWADRGVRVNAVAPTFARTALTEKLLADDDMVGEIEALTPLGRLAEAEDVAAAVLYLATPASAMVTGHTLAVDGGWLAR